MCRHCSESASPVKETKSFLLFSVQPYQWPNRGRATGIGTIPQCLSRPIQDSSYFDVMPEPFCPVPDPQTWVCIAFLFRAIDKKKGSRYLNAVMSYFIANPLMFHRHCFRTLSLSPMIVFCVKYGNGEVDQCVRILAPVIGRIYFGAFGKRITY